MARLFATLHLKVRGWRQWNSRRKKQDGNDNDKQGFHFHVFPNAHPKPAPAHHDILKPIRTIDDWMTKSGDIQTPYLTKALQYRSKTSISQ
jgi:hypothetical protein